MVVRTVHGGSSPGLRRPRTVSARRAGTLFFLGLFAVQLAWIFSVPAFRGLDEHDHVYRADAVAHGQWVAPGDRAPESRGDLVSVRASIVRAAGPVCSALPYTDTYDCTAYGPDGEGRVLIASAAARYHPAFYAVIGTVAKPFEGEAAVLAMRVATALMCSGLVAVALASWRAISSSPWMPSAFIVVLTPTMTYSSAVAAPNGVEMAAALLAWVSLLRLLHARGAGRRLPVAPVAAATSALVLVATLRSIGPAWALLIVGACLMSAPGALHWCRRHRRALVVPILVVTAAALAGSLWTLSQGTNDPSQDAASFPSPDVASMLRQPLLWFFQSIAAFPTRSERSLPVVYALVGLVAIAFVGAGLWRADRRLRWTMATITAIVIVLPLALTVVSYEEIGFAWQGRYAWPLSMGVPLLAGLALSRGAARPTVRRVAILGTVAAAAAATSVSQVWVISQEIVRAWAADGWQLVSPVVVVTLTLVGFASMGMAHGQVRSPSSGDHVGHAVDDPAEQRALG